MSTSVLIVGHSGTGKSKSIESLNSKETFIVNVMKKPMPFKGWKSKYPIQEKGKNGHMMNDDSPLIIQATLEYINKDRPDIKTVVIDDAQYIMANEFMYKITEKGYEKFNNICEHMWKIVLTANSCRDDLVVVFMFHVDTDQNGNEKAKTIGKMMDDKICLEGMFTVVLNTYVEDPQKGLYWFETQNNGKNTTKSPQGMFNSYRIPNDLSIVVNAIKQYEQGE